MLYTGCPINLQNLKLLYLRRQYMEFIKSVKGSELRLAKSEDYIIFKDWLNFLDLSPKDQKSFSLIEENIEIINDDVESGFEEEVLKYITKKLKPNKKIKIVTQYEVGSKRIDIAILDNKYNFMLGIEVDGYKYHGGMGYDKYLAYLSRQEFLEFKGYDIFRIKEIDWKLDKDEVVRKLRNVLF